MARRTRTPQLELSFCTWGGRRQGAGRKVSRPGRVPHQARAPITPRFPLHLTLKLDPGLPSLRRPRLFRLLCPCLRQGKERQGFRLVHYSVQPHHLHLIVEAHSARALSGAVRGLSIRLAKRINTYCGRKGRVFVERYFCRALRTPQEVRNALCYVLLNAARHHAQRVAAPGVGGLDPYSSGQRFDGWRERIGPPPPQEPPLVAPPRSWLLSRGWRRCGLISVHELPGSRPRSPRRRIGLP